MKKKKFDWAIVAKRNKDVTIVHLSYECQEMGTLCNPKMFPLLNSYVSDIKTVVSPALQVR